MKMAAINKWYDAWDKPIVITPALWKEIKPLIQLILARPIPDRQIRLAALANLDYLRVK